MNELGRLFENAENSSTITLEENKIYHVYQDDAFLLTSFYCSNTAKKHENPDGLRRVAIFLEDKKNIIINGNNATLLIHGKMTPLLFHRCENITVKNLIIDYARPTMTEFTVLKSEGEVCEIRINEDCPYRVEDNSIFWLGEKDKNGVPYWEDTHNGQGRYFKIFDPKTEISTDYSRNHFTLTKVEELERNILRLHFEKSENAFPEGCVVQTRSIVRDQTGSLFERCKNLEFENLRIKFMHGLGMVSQFCENVTYKNCDLTPAEGRTITSTADFFQFSGCKGNLIVENCKARGAHDDYINVHGTHLRIVEKNDEKYTITVRFMHPESWGFQAFEADDELDFIKWNTLIPYANTKVTDYERLNDTDILLRLDRPLPNIEPGKDVVENATWTPNLYVKNCDFGPTSGRGILCTTRGEVIIENNRFHNLWGPALLIEDDCNFWFESGYTREIIFRNNTVTNCDYTGMWDGSPSIRYTPKVMDENSKEFVHGKLVLKNNIFRNTRSDKHRIHLEYLKEAEITDNIFDKAYEIVEKYVGKITDKNNITQ